jgi:hypothetical protein
MKKSILLAASLLALNLTPVFGQQPAMPPAPVLPPSSPRLYAPPSTPLSPSDTQQLIEQEHQRLLDLVNPPAKQPPGLTKFNLDFPGGTPAQLVKGIEKAMGKPLNVIIPDGNADTKIPALKMSNVDVPHLFNAVVNMSYKYAPSISGFGTQQREVVSSYGFETKDNYVSDDSIWYFFVYEAPTQQAPPPPAKICQFYSLSPYLDRGFTVDDITTAIQTGWKMAGETPTPELNYHKETKLLIAFGEPNKLQTIQQVLQTLPTANQEVWRPMNERIRELQTQVDQLKKQLNPPPPVVPGFRTLSEAQEKSGK